MARGSVEAIRTAEHTRSYASVCRQVGQELDLPVLDLWTAMMQTAGWREGQTLLGSKYATRNAIFERFFTDGNGTSVGSCADGSGLHFRPAAYRLLYTHLKDVITETWPQYQPDPVLPLWRDAGDLARPTKA